VISNVPVTRKGKEWYLHILPGMQKEIRLRTNLKPISAKLLQTNEKVKFRKEGNYLIFDSPERPNGLDDVIVVIWKEVPEV
jgi:alpha-L-fucosidase